MAKVPTYDSAQVAPTTQGIAAPDINATQVAGQQTEKLGAAIEGAGSQAAYTGAILTDQFDQAANANALAQLQNKKTDLRIGVTDENGVHTTGFTEVKGLNVTKVPGPDGNSTMLSQAYPAMLQKASDEIKAKLTPRQQQLFAPAAQREMSEFYQEVSAHQAAQGLAGMQDVYSNSVVTSANTTASMLGQIGTPQFTTTVTSALTNAQDAINKSFALSGVIAGVDPKTGQPVFANADQKATYDVENKKALAGYLSTVVQAGVNNHQAPQALRFLEGFKDKIEPIDYDAVHAKVAQAAMGTNAMSQADTLLSGLDLSKPIDEMKLDARVRALNPNDFQQVEATRAEIAHRHAIAISTQQDQQQQAAQLAEGDIANGKSLADLQASSYWNTLNGSQQLTLTERAQNFSAGLANHGGQAGYDAVYGFGRYGSPSVPLSQMKLGDVQDFQSGVLIPATRGKVGAGTDKGTGAVGAYQITYGSLAQYAPKVLGPNWRDQTFTPAVQDQIAKAIWQDAKGGDLHAVWSSMPHNAPGVYANTSWEQISGTIAQRELGGLNSKAGYEAQAEAWMSDVGQLGPVTPQNTQRILNVVGPIWGPKVINAQKAYQNSITKGAMPTNDEANAAFGMLNINSTDKTPATVALRLGVRDALNTALLAAAEDKKKPLTTPERQAVIRQAAAVQVQQVGILGGKFGNYTVPLLGVSHDKLPNIIIPPDQVKDVSAKMDAAYKQTRDPRYAPGPDNLRNYYLAMHGLASK